MENNTFKSSLFGGFNREDVIDYITKTSAESTSRIAALEADIDKLCTQERELRAQLTAAQEEAERLRGELDAAQHSCEAAQYACAKADSELSTLRVEAEALRRENTTLRAENETLRPLSEQYAAVKNHIAGIELDAHQRAEAYEHSTRERLSALIAACRSHCDTVLSTLGSTCENVTAELRRTETAVSSLPSAFDSLRSGLDELEQEK